MINIGEIIVYGVMIQLLKVRCQETGLKKINDIFYLFLTDINCQKIKRYNGTKCN